MKKCLLATLSLIQPLVLVTAITSSLAQSTPAVMSLLLMNSSTGIAREVQMSWERPQSRENNTLLNEEDIDYYILRYRQSGSENGFYTFIIVDSPATSTAATITGQSGTVFEISISAIDQTGLSSKYSSAVLLTI